MWTRKSSQRNDYYRGDHQIQGIRFRPVRTALGLSSFGVNWLELDPHTKGYPEHNHLHDGQEELYLVVEGSLILLVEGGEQVFRQGDLVVVSPETTRKFVTRDQGATLLAVGGVPGQAFPLETAVG